MKYNELSKFINIIHTSGGRVVASSNLVTPTAVKERSCPFEAASFFYSKVCRTSVFLHTDLVLFNNPAKQSRKYRLDIQTIDLFDISFYF